MTEEYRPDCPRCGCKFWTTNHMLIPIGAMSHAPIARDVMICHLCAEAEGVIMVEAYEGDYGGHPPLHPVTGNVPWTNPPPLALHDAHKHRVAHAKGEPYTPMQIKRIDPYGR